MFLLKKILMTLFLVQSATPQKTKIHTFNKKQMIKVLHWKKKRKQKLYHFYCGFMSFLNFVHLSIQYELKDLTMVFTSSQMDRLWLRVRPVSESDTFRPVSSKRKTKHK